MARYRGSIFKKARRYGFSILENDKEFSKGKKRTTPPGQHGQRRSKLSNYGLQLHEKQKVCYMYGLTERQFRNTYSKSKKMKGITGTNFLIMLESRLDNIVHRMGLSQTRAGARQLVNHAHILVNRKKVDIPSYNCKPGDVISIKESSQKNVKILESLYSQVSTLEFVKFDKTKMTGTYVRFPLREELNSNINEALIVEWYNRLV
ncbi:30S ribosomal protein S4 [Spiroplasma kunkelii CR2-3x]|uniref:Small ribosomal subunit protein uS4 n=1 Tax=Spiroplasma kunkelii CR2-3x TaxID=273035 RepID=A0A0K2JFX2_SPIKU|nr:30S ribosomal protein S4 [Spiroplasma kunkelii]ALA97307.1 30S ribosomal protein S4 [Spiroplasma kunkelii CR2-3x]